MRKEIKKLMDAFGITIRKRQLPGARGMVVKTRQGYVILVDDRLTQAAAERAAAHEMLHIMLGHFDDRRDMTVEEKETEIIEIIREHFGG